MIVFNKILEHSKKQMIILSHPSDCMRSNIQFHVREDLHVDFTVAKMLHDYFEPCYLKFVAERQQTDRVPGISSSSIVGVANSSSSTNRQKHYYDKSCSITKTPMDSAHICINLSARSAKHDVADAVQP